MSLTEPTRPSTDSTGHPRKPVTANNMVRSLLANRVPCWLWSAGGGAVERHVDPSCLTLMVLSPDQMLNPIDSSFGTLASAPTWVSMPCSHLFSLTVATFDVELDLVPKRAGVPTLDPSCRTISITSRGVDQVARIAGKNASNPLLPTLRDVNGKELSDADFIEFDRHFRLPFLRMGRRARAPAPVPDLRQILAMRVDVTLVLDEFVSHHLLQIRAFAPQMGQFVHDVLHQMKAIDLVLHAHVKRGGDCALFLVTPNMKVPVGSTVGQSMDERGISVEIEYDRPIRREERVVVGLAQSMRMLRAGLESHQIDDVDDPNLQIGQMFAQDGNGGQNLERRRVAAAGHHDIRFRVLVVARPLPDADSLGAMDDGLLYGEPLRQRVLARYDDVDVVPSAQAMVEHRQEAIGVRRQLNPNDVRLLVDHVIEEAGVLMGEAIMVLLPDVRSEEVIQRRDLAPPRQFERDLQPFRMLAARAGGPFSWRVCVARRESARAPAASPCHAAH